MVLPKHKSMCLMHIEAKQYQNIRVWSRERFIEGQARRQVAPALKPPNSQKFSAKPCFRKGEGGMCLVVTNFLVSDPLFPRSGLEGLWKPAGQSPQPAPLAPARLTHWPEAG